MSPATIFISNIVTQISMEDLMKKTINKNWLRFIILGVFLNVFSVAVQAQYRDATLIFCKEKEVRTEQRSLRNSSETTNTGKYITWYYQTEDMKAGKYSLWLSSPQPFEAWIAKLNGANKYEYKITNWFTMKKAAVRQTAPNGAVYYYWGPKVFNQGKLTEGTTLKIFARPDKNALDQQIQASWNTTKCEKDEDDEQNNCKWDSEMTIFGQTTTCFCQCNGSKVASRRCGQRPTWCKQVFEPKNN